MQESRSLTSHFFQANMKASLRFGAAFLIGRPFASRPVPSHCLYATSFYSTKNRIITYLTDIEGDAGYLDRYVNQSKVLRFCDSADASFPYSRCIEFTSENAVLVYGGDVWDRGGSDLYVIQQLLYLQQRHEGRVHLIMGNRDLNKMRIMTELGVDKLPHHNGVYWLKGRGKIGDPLLEGEGLSQTSASDRLKWMLAQTMGSPAAFDLRKKELQRQSNAEVTDEDVVASYRRSCHPMGEMGQYLQNAHLALRLGKILFVHGSLPLTQPILQEACRQQIDLRDFWSNFDWCMPWKKPSSSTLHEPDSVDGWLKALEKFAREHVSAWQRYVEQLEKKKGQMQNGVWSTKGGYDCSDTEEHHENLLQYGMGWTPDGLRNPTVVYSSWLNDGLPYRFLPDVSSSEDIMFASLTREFFNASNLQLIVSGHQPHGDAPIPIRIGESQSILCCDTSYSGDTIWWNESGDKDRKNLGRGSASTGRGDVAVR